tara:strand:- start:1020 stop:1898 length:879 start_codon:yes stop_codon:yes gene_type:complete
MRKVYFGNTDKQLWIPAPQTGMAASANARVVENQLLSGRTMVLRSQASSRRFEASWLGGINSDSLEDSLQTIKDFFDGVYGNGPFYWVDPYAQKTNLLAPHWAAPGITRADWPEIASFAATSFPATVTNLNNYPTQSVRYNVTSTAEVTSTRKVTLIIPSGHTLHFGWHGVVDSGDGGVRITRYARSGGAATNVDPAVIGVTSSNRTNTSISGDVYSHVEIYLYKPASASSDFTVSGMMAQILEGSNYPAAGGFISGRGTTSLEFATAPQIEYYSANVGEGRIGMSVSWQEV